MDHEGQTFAWGGNEYGQAGVDCGTAGNGVHVSLHLSVPAVVLASVRVKQVACGGMNSFAVVEHSGEVYQWGQTVGSEKEPMRQPAKVAGAHGVVQIAAGSFHALALQEDGRVLSWGNGDYGQLGLGRGLEGPLTQSLVCIHSSVIFFRGALTCLYTDAAIHTVGQTSVLCTGTLYSDVVVYTVGRSDIGG